MRYTVAIVADRAFGDRLAALARRVHVWVCDTPANRPVAEQIWSQPSPEGEWNDHGVTTFRCSEGEPPEEMVLSNLAMIDLHHGEYSHDPLWSRLEVFGVGPTPRLRDALGEYGVTAFTESSDGFACSRPPSLADLRKA